MIYGRINLIDRIDILSYRILLFHNFCILITRVILFRVNAIYFICVNKKIINTRTITKASIVEATWTIIPVFFLASLRIPCFFLLYALENEKKYDYTVKSIRHQWY